MRKTNKEEGGKKEKKSYNRRKRKKGSAVGIQGGQSAQGSGGVRHKSPNGTKREMYQK